jgi:hypothetical protein
VHGRLHLDLEAGSGDGVTDSFGGNSFTWHAATTTADDSGSSDSSGSGGGYGY